MRIVAVHDAVYPIRSKAANAAIDFSQMTVSVVAVVTDVIRDGEPVVGYAFNTNGRYAASGLMRERFLPRLMDADPASLIDAERDNLDPLAIWDCVMRNEKPGGHGERSVAVGVLDIAVWDAVAKIAGQPMHRLLAERFGDGTPDEDVYVYAAGGYYHPEKGLDGLIEEVESYRARGYGLCKIKIGGAPLAEDMERIEAAAGIVGGGHDLAVDANGRFDLETAIAYGDAMTPLGLRWFEEPGDPLDYDLNAKLAERYGPALATGENLFSLPDAVNLVRYGGMRPTVDYMQFDCTLAYGYTEYIRILDMLRAEGWDWRQVLPHGGHLMSLHLAAGLKLGGSEAYPDVFKPFSGFSDDIPVIDSRVGLPDVPGMGFETQREAFDLMYPVSRGERG